MESLFYCNKTFWFEMKVSLGMEIPNYIFPEYCFFLLGMKTGLIAICRKSNPYAISQKGHNDWAHSARNIFNLTAALIAGNCHIT